MKTNKIIAPSLLFIHDHLIGSEVIKSNRKLSDMSDYFLDVQSYEKMDRDTLLYEVYSYIPKQNQRENGALNFGITHVYPGKVGQEYFMTKGHFHAQENRAEYYWGIAGEGVLILMDRQRKVWGEKIFPGSLHYIPGEVAHRVSNTGNRVLSFAACWPADAGHDYEEITRNGFSARVIDINGTYQLI